MKLSESPPKDGIRQEYDCGLVVIGSWAGREEDHDKFCKTKTGKYILKLEKELEFMDKFVSIVKNESQSRFDLLEEYLKSKRKINP